MQSKSRTIFAAVITYEYSVDRTVLSLVSSFTSWPSDTMVEAGVSYIVLAMFSHPFPRSPSPATIRAAGSTIDPLGGGRRASLYSTILESGDSIQAGKKLSPYLSHRWPNHVSRWRRNILVEKVSHLDFWPRDFQGFLPLRRHLWIASCEMVPQGFIMFIRFNS